MSKSKSVGKIAANVLDWLLEPDDVGVRYLTLRALRVLNTAK